MNTRSTLPAPFAFAIAVAASTLLEVASSRSRATSRAPAHPPRARERQLIERDSLPSPDRDAVNSYVRQCVRGPVWARSGLSVRGVLQHIAQSRYDLPYFLPRLLTWRALQPFRATLA